MIIHDIMFNLIQQLFNVMWHVSQHLQFSSLICTVAYTTFTLSFKDRVLLQDNELIVSDKQVQVLHSAQV